MATRKPTNAQLKNAFLLLSSVSPFKLGDRVKVLRNFKDYELGSPVESINDADAYVGREYDITEVDTDGTYELNNDYYWPFFVLELVKSATAVKLNDDYTAVVSEDGKTVKVGCQDIPAAAVLELAEKVRTVQSEFKPPAKPVSKRKR